MMTESISNIGKTKEELFAGLESGVRGVMNTERFKDFLATAGRHFCNNYSFRNALLVSLQKPDATFCMGYDSWKNVGRQVKAGATGAKIVTPAFASEKEPGGLYRQIKQGLKAAVNSGANADKPFVTYRLGESNLDFTMNRANGVVGFRIGGQEKGFFKSDESLRRYIDHKVLNKVPMYFSVATVFDEKDTVTPETLWVKTGFIAADVVKDKDGNPMVNSNGATRIVNTPERQARHTPSIVPKIAEHNTNNMIVLFEAASAVSGRDGVPVIKHDKRDDNELTAGAKGYYSKETTAKHPGGLIVIDKDLTPTESCAVLLHEMAHSRLHNPSALAIAAEDGVVTRAHKETQAEAAAYMTASQFGLKTDDWSFGYIASYAQGVEARDLLNSLETVFSESRRLSGEIAVELDSRGRNMDLTKKKDPVLSKTSVNAICKRCSAVIAGGEEKLRVAAAKLSVLVERHADNPEIRADLSGINNSLTACALSIEKTKAAVDAFRGTATRGAAARLERKCEGIQADGICMNAHIAAMDVIAFGDTVQTSEEPAKLISGLSAEAWNKKLEGVKREGAQNTPNMVRETNRPQGRKLAGKEA